jgi:hypothetical protein
VLYKLAYLVQKQLGILMRKGKFFFLTIIELFDERSFCKQYLRLYKQLKQLDLHPPRSGKYVKFSSAFSDFTCLIYANFDEFIKGQFFSTSARPCDASSNNECVKSTENSSIGFSKVSSFKSLLISLESNVR